MPQRAICFLSVIIAAGLCGTGSVQADGSGRQRSAAADRQGSDPSGESGRPLSLRFASFQDEGGGAGTSTAESEGWEISGPVFLRSTDPEPPGEVIIKNIFGWETTKGGGDDDFEYELEIEWGIIEDHELILELPVEIGDGRIDGNADLTLGWHWRLWKEQDALPSFGMRNFVRFPTGVDSSGVDYEWRGLITKTVVANEMRVHANPFVASINGNNEEDARHFLWGTALGMDWRLSDDVLLIADYIYSSGELEHTRDNHTGEVGIDWNIDEHQKLGVAAEVGLDGDGNGPAFGLEVSYMLSFGG